MCVQQACVSEVQPNRRPTHGSLSLSLLHLNPGDTTDPLSGGSLLGNTKSIVRVTH